jgi:hypothetical protein
MDGRDTPMTRHPRLTMRASCHQRSRNQLIDFAGNFAAARNVTFTPGEAKLPRAAEIAGLFTHR